MKTLILLIVIVCATCLWAQTKVRRPDSTEPDFGTFLTRWEEAQSRFINGDPTLWKQSAWHGDEATIFGAFGGHEKGWNEVGPRYDWASSQFKESGAKIKIEYLNSGVSGDLAFTVALSTKRVYVWAIKTSGSAGFASHADFQKGGVSMEAPASSRRSAGRKESTFVNLAEVSET